MKGKRRRLKRKFVYLATAVCVTILTTILGTNAKRVYYSQQTYNSLAQQQETLAKEKETLQKDIKKLSTRKGAIQYAREKYVFLDDEETVIRIPE